MIVDKNHFLNLITSYKDRENRSARKIKPIIYWDRFYLLYINPLIYHISSRLVVFSWHASCRLTLVLRCVKTSLRIRAYSSRSLEMLLFTSCCFRGKRNFHEIVLGNRKENTVCLHDLSERYLIALKKVASETGQDVFFMVVMNKILTDMSICGKFSK